MGDTLRKHVSRIKRIFVDFYWHEKLLLLLDTFQIYGLLWITAQPWPWPYLWVYWTRFMVVFNIDIFSLYPTGALAGRTNNIGISKYGNIDGYLYYSVAFAACEIAFVMMILYANHIADTYAKHWYKYKAIILAVALYAGYLFYLPLTISLFRLYYCDPITNALSADPQINCMSSDRLAILCVCSIIHLPVILWVPYCFYYYAKDLSFYDLNSDHEKRQQMWEMTYLLDINDDYKELQCWTISSFRRNGAYFRFHLLLLKLYLASVFIGCRNSYILQAMLCLIGVSLFFGYYGLRTTSVYRCKSTGWILTVTSVLLIVDCAFGLANALGVSNFLMVSSTESLTLLITNVVGAACVCLVMVLSFMNPVVKWPSVHTISNISQDERLNALSLAWVDAMNHANDVKLSYLNASPEMADIDGMEECIRCLRQCWLAACTVGSVFNLALSELLEELLFIHSCHAKESIRSKDHWNEAFASVMDSKRFQARHVHNLMMAPRKRRILTKLLSMRTLLQGIKSPTDIAMKQLSNSKQRKYSRKQSTITQNPLTDVLAQDSIVAARAIIAKLVTDSLAKLSSENSTQMHQMMEILNKPAAPPDVESTMSNAVARSVTMEKRLDVVQALEELLDNWNYIIDLYENHSLPGMQSDDSAREVYSDVEVENWYTYRNLLSEQHQLLALRKELSRNPSSSQPTMELWNSFGDAEDYGVVGQMSGDADDDDDDDLDALLGLHSGWNRHHNYNDGNEISNV